MAKAKAAYVRKAALVNDLKATMKAKYFPPNSRK